MGVPPDDSPREVEIESLGAGGRGVARVDGRVWFVDGGLPGDRVLARAIRDHPRFVEAGALATVRPSPDRREPPCPFQSACGGCPWMALPESEQRRFKRRLVVDALERIARVPGARVEPVVHGARSLGYRNRVEFQLGERDGRAVLGLRARGGEPGVVDVSRCLLQTGPANDVLASVRDLLGDRPAPPSPAGAAEPLRVLIRASERGEVLVVLREPGREFPGARELAREIAGRHPAVRGVIRLRAHPRRRGGARAETLVGQSGLEEGVVGFDLRLPAASFVQVNPELTRVLVELVLAAAAPVAGAAVLDLYAGVGLYALALARAGARPVTAVDADARALDCGREAARRHGLAGALRTVHADVGRALAAGGPAVDVVVANPPRRGLDRGVVEAIAARRPSRVVLVSCDPATFARDVARFARLGYRCERVVPVDLFPQTAHVEVVAGLAREDAGPRGPASRPSV